MTDTPAKSLSACERHRGAVSNEAGRRIATRHVHRSPTPFPTASTLQYRSDCRKIAGGFQTWASASRGSARPNFFPVRTTRRAIPSVSRSILTIGTPCRRKDGVKMGCYVPGRGGRTSSLDFNYAAYDGWIRRLSLMALGVEPEEVWNHPRRFRGKPFVELINFPDAGGGAIGPITSAKLYGDFVTFAPRAKRYYATSTPNVFNPPQVNPQSAKDKTHRNRMGLSAVVGLAQALGGTVSDGMKERTWIGCGKVTGSSGELSGSPRTRGSSYFTDRLRGGSKTLLVNWL